MGMQDWEIALEDRKQIQEQGTKISDLRAENLLLRSALVKILRDYGKVCPGYEMCTHASCASSYGAWATADQALKGIKSEA
jgi:hypothetical protein